jgi:hypothetical protein
MLCSRQLRKSNLFVSTTTVYFGSVDTFKLHGAYCSETNIEFHTYLTGTEAHAIEDLYV